MSHDIDKKLVDQDQDIELIKDYDWAMMVKLYPEDFTELEYKEAQEIIKQTPSQKSLDGWDTLSSGLSEFRKNENCFISQISGPIGLSEQGKDQLIKAAINIAEANQKRRGQQGANPKKHQAWFISFSQPFTWAFMFGFALIGLWTYQQDFKASLENASSPVLTEQPKSEKSDKAEKTEKAEITEKTEKLAENFSMLQSKIEADAEEELSAKGTVTLKDETNYIATASKTQVSKPTPKSKPRAKKQVKSRQARRRTKTSYSSRKSTGSPKKNSTSKSSNSRREAANQKLAKKRKAKKQQSVSRSTSLNEQTASGRGGASKTASLSSPQTAFYSTAQAPMPAQAPQPGQAPMPAPSREDSVNTDKLELEPTTSQLTPLDANEVVVEEKANKETTEQNKAAERAQAEDSLDSEKDDVLTTDESEVELAQAPSEPPPPWQDAVEIWAQGDQVSALRRLMSWIERNRYHRQRETAIRLGMSWARMMKNKKALTQLEALKAEQDNKKFRRQKSNKRGSLSY